MSISGIPVGSDIRPVMVIGDSLVAGQYAIVIPIADAISLAGANGLVNLSSLILKNPGGTFDQLRAAIGTTGILAVSTESTKTTYSTVSLGITLAATATDFWTINGSGTKTIRLIRLAISGFATSGASVDIQLLKRSTADTGGTSTAPTIVPNDSNSAAGSAVVALYTANPGALGTLVGPVRAKKLNLGATGSAGLIEWSFSDKNDQALVLRGAAQGLCLNFNGQAVPSGTTIDVEAEWTEE